MGCHSVFCDRTRHESSSLLRQSLDIGKRQKDMNRRDLMGALAVGAGIGASLAAPASAQETAAAAGSHLAKILERGVLRVGTTGDFNPMSFRDTASNSYQGYDIEALTALAADLGVTLEWVPTDWATLTTGISADRFDIFSGASISVPRARVAAFSVPYTEVGTVPLALKGNADRFPDWASIDTAGVKVAVSLGTVFEEQAKRHFPKATIQAVQTPATGFQEVLAGRADVTITSNIEAASLVSRFAELKVLVPASELRNRRPLAYVVDQGDHVWLHFVNTWTTLRRTEGFYTKLDAKWLGQA
jgi:cyclohexadienyl dehydratase